MNIEFMGNVILLFIISIALMSFWGLAVGMDDKISSTILFILGFIACVWTSVLLVDYLAGPTAIDVYRGKTTLEITYNDSIPIDSVVVYK